MSWMSDDESLAGLTQEPSQEPQQVNLDSSDDGSFHGFNLIPAADLILAPANEETDFSQFVTAIDSDNSSQSLDHDKSLDASQDLFDRDSSMKAIETSMESTQVSLSVGFNAFNCFFLNFYYLARCIFR